MKRRCILILLVFVLCLNLSGCRVYCDIDFEISPYIPEDVMDRIFKAAAEDLDSVNINGELMVYEIESVYIWFGESNSIPTCAVAYTDTYVSSPGAVAGHSFYYNFSAIEWLRIAVRILWMQHWKWLIPFATVLAIFIIITIRWLLKRRKRIKARIGTEEESGSLEVNPVRNEYILISVLIFLLLGFCISVFDSLILQAKYIDHGYSAPVRIVFPGLMNTFVISEGMDLETVVLLLGSPQETLQSQISYAWDLQFGLRLIVNFWKGSLESTQIVASPNLRWMIFSWDHDGYSPDRNRHLPDRFPQEGTECYWEFHILKQIPRPGHPGAGRCSLHCQCCELVIDLKRRC